jgi:hypothetical protein
MNNKKYIAIPLILIVGLGIAGMAYASWWKNLWVEGTVSTGSPNWDFTTWVCIDQGVDYHCNEGFAGHNFWPDPEGKDVGWQAIEPYDSDGNGFADVLFFDLYNVYPSYFTMLSLYAQNTGDIPIVFDGVSINGVVYLRHSPTPPTIRLDLNGDGYDDIEIWWGNGFGVQLEPGDYTDEMSMWIHVIQNPNNNVVGGLSFYFEITLVALNWNEYHP